MRRLVPVRFICAVALVAAGSSALGAFASPASASPTRVTCSSLVAKLTGTGTLKKCTDPAATGGSGAWVYNKTTKTAKLTWNKTGTTMFTIAYASPKKGAKVLCPKGSTEILISGAVTGGTGAAIKAIPKGSKVSAAVCYKTNATLAPKTVITF